MTVATFYTSVRTAIGRGTANDAVFPEWAQEMVDLVEDSRSYQWMRKQRSYALAAGANSNRITLAAPVKSVEWVKFGTTSGSGAQLTTYYGEPLAIVDPFRVTSIDNGYAGAGYIEGARTLVLDALPQEAATLWVAAYEKTVWPSDTSQTPDILAEHYAFVKAKFMLTAAMNLRDDRLAAIWKGVSDVAEAAVIGADTEREYKGRRGMHMGQYR